ncbi:MAG: response regulator [Acidobacteriota bacterium]
MSVIAIFSSTYCSGKEVAEKAAQKMGYELIGNSLLAEAALRFKVPEEKLARAMSGPPSFFNSLFHEREHHIAYVRAVLADQLKKDNLVHYGFAMHLLPRYVSHILRVCLVANREYRANKAVEQRQIPKKEALKLLKRDDEEASQWTGYLHGSRPWDKKLYDIRIPIHNTTLEAAVNMICEQAGGDALKPTPDSSRAVDDFILATKVNLALVEKGHHYCDVTSSEGQVTIVINKEVLRLERLENELAKIAESVEGVNTVHTKVGPKYNQANISYQIDLQLPSRVLLVDDEKDFVLTLSERLQMRDINSSVVYDGEQALSHIKGEEPDVMVLDLRMPGIDGLEVLRRVKKEHPGVEVIILTGHGTEKDEALAMELGAFAYLQKPVDIDVLAGKMREAYQRIAARKAAVEKDL